MNSPRAASPFGTMRNTPRPKGRLSPRESGSLMDCDTAPSRPRGGFQCFATAGARSPRPISEKPSTQGFGADLVAETRSLSPREVEIRGFGDEMVDNGGSIKESNATEGYSHNDASRCMEGADRSVATPNSPFGHPCEEEEEVDSGRRGTAGRTSARSNARFSKRDEKQASAGGLNVRSSTETCESTTPPRKNVSMVAPSSGKAREHINFFDIMDDVTPERVICTPVAPPTELAPRQQHQATPYPSLKAVQWNNGEYHANKWCRDNIILEDVDECQKTPLASAPSASRSPGSVPPTLVVSRAEGTPCRASLSNNNDSPNTFHTPQAEWSGECPTTVVGTNQKGAEVTSVLRAEWPTPAPTELTFGQNSVERCNQENHSPSAGPCPLSVLRNEYASQEAGLTDDGSSCSDAGFGNMNKENSRMLASAPPQRVSHVKLSDTFGDPAITPQAKSEFRKGATTGFLERTPNTCPPIGMDLSEDVCMDDVGVEKGQSSALPDTGLEVTASGQLDSQQGCMEGGSQGGAKRSDWEFPVLCEGTEEPKLSPHHQKTPIRKCLTREEICRLSLGEFTTDMVATMEEDIAKVVTQLQPGSSKHGRDRSAKRKKGPHASPRSHHMDGVAGDAVPRWLYEKEQHENKKLRGMVQKLTEENSRMTKKVLMLQEQLKILDHKASLYYSETQKPLDITDDLCYQKSQTPCSGEPNTAHESQRDQQIEGWSDWLAAKCQVESSQEALKHERDLRSCIEKEVEQGRQALSKMEIDASEMKEKLLGSLLEQEELRKKFREADKKVEESEKEILKLRTEVVQGKARIQRCEEVEKEKKVPVMPRSKIPSAQTHRFGRGNSMGKNGGAYKRFRM